MAEGVEEFAAACVRLMRDPEARRRLGRAGRQTVIDHYSWEANGREFRAALEGAVELYRARHGESVHGAQPD